MENLPMQMESELRIVDEFIMIFMKFKKASATTSLNFHLLIAESSSRNKK